MAKRKRLTPANTQFLDDTQAPVQTLARAAPIAEVAGEASSAAALDEMAHVLRQAREEGRMVLALPLDSIQADYLVRDRVVMDFEGMETLKHSLRQRGQQTPIEVEALGGDRYGLISGWRRLRALKDLQAERGPGAEGDTVQALLRTPEQSSDAYLAMVEENEIRVGLSFFERARIAVRAAEIGVFETETAALRGLFHAVPRAKRSKIKSFIRIVHALDDVLKYPEVISEKFGLSLAKALDENKALAAKISARLREARASGLITDGAAELSCIQKTIAETKKGKDTPITDPIKAENAKSEVPHGVRARTNSDGSLTLYGPSLTAEFRKRLMRWLSEQGD